MAGTVLIDADIIVHRFASSNHRVYDWGGGKQAVVVDEAKAQRGADSMVSDIQRLTECGRAVLCLSEPDIEFNWRRKVLSTYKWNRGKGANRKPKGFWRLRDYLERKYKVESEPTLEADDILGMLLTGSRYSGRKVCASIDKDLLTVPGLHFQWVPTKAGGLRTGVFKIGKPEAYRRFMLQVLMGDSTDGYTGLPGCGPVGADKILGDLAAPKAMWGAIVEAYEAEGLTKKDALVQARVARILQCGEYKEFDGVQLWTPPA